MANVKRVGVYLFFFPLRAKRKRERSRRGRRLARFARRENKNRRGGKRWRGREIVREIEREGEKVN